MKTTVLVIGVIKNEDRVLLRKKPDGSMPYKETWYLFGGEVAPENPNPEVVLKDHVKKTTGVDINPIQKLSWDIEIKFDHSGEETFYVYIDYLCEYVSGELTSGEGIEKLEWVSIDQLKNYDLVPPSVKLFRRLGYID